MEKVHDKLNDYPQGRRKLLLYFWFGAQALLGAIVVIPGLRYFLQPLYEKAQSKRIQLGDYRAIPENEPTKVDYSVVRQAGYRVQEQHNFVYVLRDGNTLKVFSPVCTHMGCNVAWNPGSQEFQCPCHGGRYNKEGQVIAGPPPQPLHTFPSEIEDGGIWITLGELQS